MALDALKKAKLWFQESTINWACHRWNDDYVSGFLSVLRSARQANVIDKAVNCSDGAL